MDLVKDTSPGSGHLHQGLANKSQLGKGDKEEPSRLREKMCTKQGGEGQALKYFLPNL